MQRFEQMFARLKREKKKALGVYLTVGDPSSEATAEAALAALEAGADFIELGAPFSDPSADGPSIQKAMERALAKGTKFADVATVAKTVRAAAPEAPIVLFGYGNPYFRAQQRGDLLALSETVDGLLLVDVPAEHASDFASLRGKIASIRLLAPNATEPRRQAIASTAEGFIYLVAYAGVTGAAANRDGAELVKLVAQMRALTDVPLCVGFGIKTGADARAMAQVADGVIAGTVFVEALSQATSVADARSRVSVIVRDLRQGLSDA